MTPPDHRSAAAPEPLSTLALLRNIAPERPLRIEEAIRVAELQASRLLELSGIVETPVPSDVITRLPRIAVEHDFDMPDSASGASNWNEERKTWVITINARQSDVRQRFTLLHEYKHVVDHGRPPMRTDGSRRYYRLAPVEYVADYFAGCALMPRGLVKRAWGRGVHSTTELACLFDVSERAMEVRLSQLQLVAARSRCNNDNEQLHMFSGDAA